MLEKRGSAGKVISYCERSRFDPFTNLIIGFSPRALGHFLPRWLGHSVALEKQ